MLSTALAWSQQWSFAIVLSYPTITTTRDA
jgi:hypothetical protein